MLAYLIGLVAGVTTPVQASANARIREENKSPYITALLNFIAAGSLLAVIILISERGLYIPFAVIAKEPAWIWLGGVCGMTIITLNIICLPRLGSARNVMLMCFGQIMLGLAIDHFGLFYSPVVRMSLIRLAGAILVIAGISMVNNIRAGRGKDRQESSPGSDAPFLYVILSVISGFACAMQIAVNGALKENAGSGLKATLISMAVGLITACIVAAGIILFKGRNGLYDGGNRPGNTGFRPWMVSGGFLAVVVVGGNAIAAPVLGTGIVTILNLVGMMAAGLVIDATGFLGIEKKPVTAGKVIGMILMITGAAIISLF